MATAIKESFRQLAGNLNITDRQTNIVTNCKNNVVTKIGREISLHPQQARLIGSWDRDTLTRYLHEGDVDVMVVLHYSRNEAWYCAEDARNVLVRFKRILDASFPITPCNVDQNCVTMKLKEFRLDVVPAIFWNDGSYRIPDTHLRRWLVTNPIAFADGITAINRNMQGAFVPFVKMVKDWNRAAGWPIRSFHLECLLYYHCMTWSQAYSYSSMVAGFLQ